MRLLLDIGNTRIKWAYEAGGQLLHPGSQVHRGDANAAVAAFLQQLHYVPEAVAAVNVAGPAIETLLKGAVFQRFGLELQFVRTAARCGAVSNGYSAYHQLGADRRAAVVGAWHAYRRPVCIVDAGTAVTIDMLAESGQHRGGVIVPGLTLLRSSLLRDTSDIEPFVNQRIGAAGGDGWLGTDTHSAVERGILLMLASTIDRAARMLSSTGAQLPTILTGGDATLLAPVLTVEVEQRPLLVLEGLRHLLAECSDA